MTDDDLSRRLELGLAAAREAGRLTLHYFRRGDLAVERKQDASPVTIADRRRNNCCASGSAAAFPDDAILGEEFPERAGSSGYRWIVDPIDGTKSFIHGVPLYGTLIGLEHQTRSVLGIIVLPALDECLYAAVGQGAWHVAAANRRCGPAFRDRGSLAESLFCTSETASFGKRGAAAVYDGLQAAARLGPHLGRLLRLLSGGHRPGRVDGRSDHERVGRRGVAADHGRSRRHLHRLARPPDDPFRRRSGHQRPRPRRSASHFANGESAPFGLRCLFSPVRISEPSPSCLATETRTDVENEPAHCRPCRDAQRHAIIRALRLPSGPKTHRGVAQPG